MQRGKSGRADRFNHAQPQSRCNGARWSALEHGWPAGSCARRDGIVIVLTHEHKVGASRRTMGWPFALISNRRFSFSAIVSRVALLSANVKMFQTSPLIRSYGSSATADTPVEQVVVW
jgi:hypothetical protein